MVPTTAFQTFENHIKQIRASNLNFAIHETPYSTQVCLRKRYIKEASGPLSYCSLNITHADKISQKVDLEVLENKLFESERECSRYKEVIAVLEEKVQQTEENLFNKCSKKKTSENSKL